MVKIPVKKSFCVCRRRQTIFFVFLTVRLLETVLIHGIIVKNNRWLSVKTTYGLVKSTNSRCIFPQNFCKMQVYQTKMPFGQIENDSFPSGGNYERNIRSKISTYAQKCQFDAGRCCNKTQHNGASRFKMGKRRFRPPTFPCWWNCRTFWVCRWTNYSAKSGKHVCKCRPTKKA